jgi:G3E family GTPase
LNSTSNLNISESIFGRTHKRAGGFRMPVIVVTGFLGAGKTTLIRSLLESSEGMHTAIIVNEFGEIGIDQALLSPGSDETVLLGNGCLCCRISNDLQKTCTNLLRERTRGTVPPFERIFLETSGLADPTPILQTFISDRALRDDFHLLGIIAVVDAASFEGTVNHFQECLRQVVLADRIIVTKSDLLSTASVAIVSSKLQQINPSAQIRLGDHGRVEPAVMLDFDDLPARYFSIEPIHHTSGIDTFSIVIDKPLKWSGFSQAMSMLSTLRGADLLRVKGLVNVQGSDGPVVIHLVQHLAHPPVQLQDWPSEDRRTILIFIVRGMIHSSVRNVIQSVQEAMSV